MANLVFIRIQETIDLDSNIDKTLSFLMILDVVAFSGIVNFISLELEEKVN